MDPQTNYSSPTWSTVAGMVMLLNSWFFTPGEAIRRSILVGKWWTVKKRPTMTSLLLWCPCTWSLAPPRSHSVLDMLSRHSPPDLAVPDGVTWLRVACMWLCRYRQPWMRLWTEVPHVYTHAKRPHTHVKDSVIHVRVWWIMESPK